MSTQFRMPTPDEMTALKAAAHRARARWMKVILLRGVRALKWRLAHVSAVSAPSRVSHA
jgi:hypothetical protein